MSRLLGLWISIVGSGEPDQRSGCRFWSSMVTQLWYIVDWLRKYWTIRSAPAVPQTERSVIITSLAGQLDLTCDITDGSPA